MITKFIEATHGSTYGGGNWGKFMIARFEESEWGYRSALAGSTLLSGRGWDPRHILFLDLQTGEGTMLTPGGSAHADLEKHRVWVCPMAEPFLQWLYEQDVSDLEALPGLVELPDAPFAVAGYRRPGQASK